VKNLTQADKYFSLDEKGKETRLKDLKKMGLNADYLLLRLIRDEINNSKDEKGNLKPTGSWGMTFWETMLQSGEVYKAKKQTLDPEIADSSTADTDEGQNTNDIDV